MKIFNRLLLVLSFVAAILSGCESPIIEETVSLRLNKELISGLAIGRTQKLEVTVTPADADVTLVWASDNESVAVVDEDGNVTGVTAGEAVVSVTADEAVASCKVVVLASKPEGIKLDADNVDMEIGETFRLEVTVTPAGSSIDGLVWSSNDKAIATVEDGLVTAHAVGRAKITVKCNDGDLAAVCHVNVSKPKADKVFVNSITMPQTMELKVGASSVLVPTVLPEDADDKSLTFSVEGDCVRVDAKSGKVEALKEGTATVKAAANDGSGVSAECVVSVVNRTTVESVAITAEGNATDLQVGKPLQLQVHITPDNIVPNSVSWTLDNELLASIDQNGLIVGLDATETDEGWTSVTVNVNADGVEAHLSLRVIPRQPESIEVDLPEEGYIRVGQEWRFNPRILPEELGYQAYCSATLPNGRLHNEAYGVFVPDCPGEIKAIFAVSSHPNLVYEHHRKDVILPVRPYYVETISLPQTQEVEVGGNFILTPEFTSDVAGYEPTYKDVNWTSSDESKATVDSYGKVTALAAGTVQITATTSNGYSVPSGQAQKSAVCTLTIKEATLEINVGDYYYSDGSWSSELDQSKTVIGIVFARANSASSDALLAKDYPDCVHGLVLSTEEYEQSCTSDRSWYRADLISWMSQNGYNQWLVDDKYCGYNNTQGLLALNAAKVQSNGDVIHVNHVEAVLQHREKVHAPAGASAWYVPSYMEMVELSNNLDVVNASLEKVGGTTLRRTYEYVYDRVTTGGPIPTVGVAEQHYYYSNNITENSILAYNMKTNYLVTPKVSTSPWDSVSGEKTPLPVRIVLAF